MNRRGAWLLLAGLLGCGWGAVWAAPAADLSPAEMLQRIRSAPPIRTQADSRAEAWRDLFGPEPHPIRCGTPAVLTILQGRASLPAASRPAIERLLAIPPPSRRIASVDGLEVRISRPLQPSGEEGTRGASDALDPALEETARALRTWSDLQGWLPPAEGGSGRVLPIVFEDLPDGLDALTLLDHEPEHTFEEDATATLVVSRRLLEDGRGLARTLIHQAAHAVLWAYSHREQPLWQEASAVALELQATRDAHAYFDLFSQRLQSRGRSLQPQRLREAQGAGLWALFLDVSRPAGSPALRRLWEELAAVPGDNLGEAAEAALRGSEGQGPGEEIATFLAWGLFTGEHDDGKHFPFAGSLRHAGPDAVHGEYPASGGGTGTGVEAWAGGVVRLETGNEPGGLRIQFQGDEPGRWSVLALFEGHPEGALYSAWLPVDADGRAELRFPWRGVRSATLIVANAASPGSAPARFGYSVWREPSYPFELAGFQAETEGAGILVSWTTDGESDMAGWNVYRSLSPLAGFVRLNRLPIPAGGDVREPLRYLFLDADAERGRKYYYLLEGLTTGGFSERTVAVSARTPGRTRQP